MGAREAGEDQEEDTPPLGESPPPAGAEAAAEKLLTLLVRVKTGYREWEEEGVASAGRVAREARALVFGGEGWGGGGGEQSV